MKRDISEIKNDLIGIGEILVEEINFSLNEAVYLLRQLTKDCSTSSEM